jgi:hypothetical protein
MADPNPMVQVHALSTAFPSGMPGFVESLLSEMFIAANKGATDVLHKLWIPTY